MTRRLIACAVFCGVATKAGEYAGATPFSYQGYALVITLIALAYLYSAGSIQDGQEQQR